MGDSGNARTIDSYNRHVREYVDGTPHEVSGAVKEWLDRTVADLPPAARILEFGSAFGRDADYLQRLGYRVERTDATPAFVDLLRSRDLDARVLNAITDDLPSDIDVVLANAVLVHFTGAETAAVIEKVHRSLRPGGRFAFTLKQGVGEEWTQDKIAAPRFFCYWTEPQIRDVLAAAGFEDVTVWSGSHSVGRANWLQVIAAKNVS